MNLCNNRPAVCLDEEVGNPHATVRAHSLRSHRSRLLSQERKCVARGRRYIQTFESGFDEGLRDVQLSFMQSDGGLTPVSRFSGHKAILSGPAGGYSALTILSLAHTITI